MNEAINGQQKMDLNPKYVKQGGIMAKETTIGELIKAIVIQNVGIQDCSINGKCSKCGECCTNLLPITQDELYTIAEYVINNNIKPQKQVLVMQNKLTCPYYDGKKCLIYVIRPLICREFYCYKKPSIEFAKKIKEKEYVPVDMWSLAKDIEKMRINKK